MRTCIYRIPGNSKMAEKLPVTNNKSKATEIKQTGLYWPEKRTEVEKVILPFQTEETVKLSKKRRDDLALFRQKGEPAPGWRNKLIWGDNKYIMASLLPEFAGKINLIYIDPPFATGADFSINIKLGDLEWTKEASVIEEKAYRDTWGKGLDSYLQMIYDRLVLMRELLGDDGSIYVHLDYRVCHYVKLIMDELFGKENFRNEITWRRQIPRGMKVYSKHLPYSADYLLLYTKTDTSIWNPIEKENLITRKEAEKKYMKDERGYFRTSDPGTYTDESIIKLHREGRIYVTSGGTLTIKNGKVSVTNGKIGVKYYRERRGNFVVEKTVADNIWDDIPGMGVVSSEYIGFPTQKPEGLLERIIKASSNEGDLVADFFCGSGTTGMKAEKLSRHWIMADLSKFAIHTTRKRLLDISGCKPFEVLNLGNYQKEKLKENGIVKYVDFILKLYRAEPVAGYTTIHGQKAGRMVHIGAVDSIVTEREIRDTVKECSEAGIKAADFLGWDFEMGLHDLVDTIGDEYKVKIRLVQIPKDATEVRDAAKEEIRFFDLNYLELEHNLNAKTLTISLKDFVISNPEYLPDEVREKIKNFTDYIYYWAVDFNFRDDTFHNMWQSFRMKKHPNLEKKCSYSYEDSGKYQVLVKVVDIFGNDTNKLIEVKVS